MSVSSLEMTASRVGPPGDQAVQELIAAAAADLIRENPQARLTRKLLASRAGLSLSVVCHHLNSGSLDELIARSIISAYRNEIEEVLDRRLDNKQKTDHLVSLLMSIRNIAGGLLS